MSEIDTDYFISNVFSSSNVFRKSSFKFVFAAIKEILMLKTVYNFFFRFQTDPNFARDAKMILSLAFLPTGKVINGLEALMTYLPGELVTVLEWFRYYYVEG